MCQAIRIRENEVAFGFAITTSILAVTAATVTVVAFFVFFAPPAIVIGGISATAALTVAAITLFVIRCLMQKRAVSTAALAVSSYSVEPMTPPLGPVGNLRPNSLSIVPSSARTNRYRLDTLPTSSSSSESSDSSLTNPLPTQTDAIVQTVSTTTQAPAANGSASLSFTTATTTAMGLPTSTAFGSFVASY